MGSPNIPAAPAAPDYAAANKEGIYTDIDTLPDRRRIENAARLGKTATIFNPVSGQFEEQDFTGLGDAEYARQAADLATEQNATVQRQQLALRRELGIGNVQQTREELRAADPAAFDARMDLSSILKNRLNTPDEQIDPSINVRAGATKLAELAGNAPGADGRLAALYDDGAASLQSKASDLGTIDQLRTLQQSTAGDNAARTTLGMLQKQATNDNSLGDLDYLRNQAAGDDAGRSTLGTLQGQAAGDGTAASLAALRAQAAADPGARAQYAALAGQAGNDRTSAQLDALRQAAATDPGARAQYAALAQQSANSASRNRLGSIYDQATSLPNSVTDASTSALNGGLAGALADYQLGGKLDDNTKRDLLNDVRAGQVARGNYLGDAAAVTEATELGSAADARKAQRLQALLGAQAQAFGQNSNMRDQEANLRAQKIGALTNLQGQDFGQETALRGEQANLAGLSAQEIAQMRAEQAGYGTAAAGINSQLRGEQANLAGLSAQEIAQLRAEQAGYGTNAAGINSQLRGEQAGYANTAADRTAALRGEQTGYANDTAALRSSLRGEQAGYATGAQGLTAQQTATLAQLAQQIYGTGASVRGEQLGANQARLGTLAQLAGQDQNQTQQAYTTRLNAYGQAMNGNEAIANEERAARNETLGRSQQKLANVSAMVLGQPITNQFGGLAGAQQGAVGFQPIAYQGGSNLNSNAGSAATGYAQGNYGTASNNWSTSANIAAQGSPWLALAGTALGAGAGAAGAKLGAMISATHRPTITP